MVRFPFSTQAVILNKHSFTYVLPSLAHMGSYLKEHRFTHEHRGSLLLSSVHSAYDGHSFVEHGFSVWEGWKIDDTK